MSLVELLAIDCLRFFLCSDDSEADAHQKHYETLVQPSSPATGMPHPGMTTANVQSLVPPQFGPENAMVCLKKQLSSMLSNS